MQLHVTSMLHLTQTKCYHWMNIDENWKWKVISDLLYYLYLFILAVCRTKFENEQHCACKRLQRDYTDALE